ncbi:gamma-glutamyltransferase [Podospora conica]|nr:gamma-glutamyltransferase [Schizothecium conicum]
MRLFLPYTVVMFSAVLLTSFFLWGALADLAPPWFGRDKDGKPASGAVTSGDASCSRIGMDMIRRGGTAADAAIATGFCLGVTVPDLTGIGGGGFALIRAAGSRNFSFVDFRETAPAAATEDMYKGREQDSVFGGLAVGIPGELRGLQYLHEKHGRLPWKMLVMPSVKLARDGFAVGGYFGMSMATLSSNKFLFTDPNWAVDFAPNGTLAVTGQVITRKRYAATLENIAKHGPEAFYKGRMAEQTVKAVRGSGGIMSMDDLAGYSVLLRTTSEIRYRDYRVVSTSAPSGGPVVLSALKVVEGYADFGHPTSRNLSTHRLDEALRFAYGQRTKLGDPAFVSGIEAYQESIISDSTAINTRAKISDEHTLPMEVYNPDALEVLPTPGTSHLVAADGSGMVVSLTSTVNTGFGSQLMVPESGIILNNEMNDFSIPGTGNFFGYEPSPNNFVRPGKRPQSSMTPVIVENFLTGELVLALGGQGGSRIISSVMQVLWHLLDRGQNCSSAVETPRFHDQLQPNQALFPWVYDNSTVAFMQSRGHNVTWISWIQSAVHAVCRGQDGRFEVAGDPGQVGSGGAVQ